MAETINLAQMAELLSQELFGEFLWQRSGPMNINWSCVAERHKSKTHPSDVVFFYDNPYARSRTYVNCDLKSYGKDSISAGAVNGALTSLARALACVEVSEEWQRTFVHEHVSPEFCGLLFLYNHDGEYDRDFTQLLKGVDYEALETPRRSKIVVLGPEDIFWLDNVRYEIVQMRGKGILPPQEHCQFSYPNLVRKVNVQPDKARAATLEMLTAPWITLEYLKPAATKPKGYVVFFRGRGESTDEFLYLVDHLLHYQVVNPEIEVQVKLLDAHPMAPALFDKALDQYVDECEGGDDLKARLHGIEFSTIGQVKTRFSDKEIGMRNG
jgi:hypothetical protein